MSNNALAVQLPRVLGARDVALLYTIAIVSLQWLTTAAQMGPASLLLWLLALVVFFVPSGLAVMELSSRYDGEGGLYLWVKHSFGDGLRVPGHDGQRSGQMAGSIPAG
jgi:glutamate:GABA antiporter